MPESNGGGPENGEIDERERYLLAASRLNIELSLMGSQQTLLETDQASAGREPEDRKRLAASRLNIELSLMGSQQTLLETDQASAEREPEDRYRIAASPHHHHTPRLTTPV